MTKKLLYFFTLVILYLLFWSSSANATALSVAAANCPVGQFCQVPGMVNLNLTASVGFDNAINTGGPGYDGSQAGWDSATRKLYIETAEHGRGATCPESWPNSPNVCWKKLWTYDDTTNTWTVDGPFPHYTNGDPVGTYHVFGKNAWDNVNKALYVKDHQFTVTLFRYCATNSPAAYCASQLGQWLQISQFSPPSGTIFGQMGWFPFLNGGELLYWDAEGGGCGSLRSYKEGVGWATIDPGTSCKYPYGATTNGPMILSTIKQVMIYGPSGANTKQWWRINAAGTIAALDPAPCNYFQTDGGFFQASEDPNTGNIYFFGCDGGAAGKLYKLDPTASTGNQWTLIDNDLSGAGKICAIARQGKCGFDFYATPLSNYGVIGFWKYRDNATAEYWIYKASASGGDTIAPTVSITAPSAGATVSGSAVTISATAADNVGVIGVQFKVDGVATGAEDTTSPFSITWNSASISNGAHLITATARDAAGNSATSGPISVTVSNASGGSDFTTRCIGALRCEGFDSSSVIANTLFGGNSGIDTQGVTLPTIDTTVKASGASSIKFTIPSNSSANSSGAYWLNFSDNLATQFGQNTVFYVQWRQRFSSCFLFQGSAEPCTGGVRSYTSALGWKQLMIGTGDKPGCTTSTGGQTSPRLCFGSCTDLETVPTNTLQRGFPQMYQACPGNNTDLLESFVSINGNDFKLQNARPSPYCLYQNSNYFAPIGNCFPYVADEWMTFKVKMSIGTRVNDLFTNSRVEMWVAREGQPSVKVLDCDTVCWAQRPTRPHMYAGPATGDEGDQKFGKIWLTPYNTSKDPAEAHPTAYTWYDELIVSTSDIADPSATPDTTIPTVAITSPIPPTSSSTTSPITVSGTAADNISVTSVTWTCIQCVTKGGTATSSPGTSISWLIPALDLGGTAGSFTVNVVAHDAANNASTAATLIIAYAPTPSYWVNPLASGSHCINSTSDPGVGSSSQTIAQGIACAGAVGTTQGAGKTVIVKNGVYNEILDDVFPSGSDDTHRFTLKAQNKWGAVIRPSSLPPTYGILSFATDTSWITIDGFEIDGTLQEGSATSSIDLYGIRLSSVSETAFLHWNVINNKIHNIWGTSGFNPPSSSYIANNIIYTIGYGDSKTVSNWMWGFGHAMYAGHVSNTVFEHNEFYDLYGFSIHGYVGAGTPNGTNNDIRYNYVHDNHYGAGAILWWAGDGNRFYGNIITNATGGSGSVNGFALKGNNQLIYNNTLNNLSGYGIYHDGSGDLVKNNIIWSVNTDFGTYGSLSDPYSGSSSNICGHAGTGCTVSNPNFVNPAAGNYRVQAGSPAIDTGANLGGAPFNIDYAGSLRSVPWDIGAYEFIGVPLIVTIVNPTSNPTLGVTSPLLSLGGTSNLP